MKVTQEVCEYAAPENIEAEKALAVGMAKKNQEIHGGFGNLSRKFTATANTNRIAVSLKKQ